MIGTLLRSYESSPLTAAPALAERDGTPVAVAAAAPPRDRRATGCTHRQSGTEALAAAERRPRDAAPRALSFVCWPVRASVTSKRFARSGPVWPRAVQQAVPAWPQADRTSVARRQAVAALRSAPRCRAARRRDPA